MRMTGETTRHSKQIAWKPHGQAIPGMPPPGAPWNGAAGIGGPQTAIPCALPASVRFVSGVLRTPPIVPRGWFMRTAHSIRRHLTWQGYSPTSVVESAALGRACIQWPANPQVSASGEFGVFFPALATPASPQALTQATAAAAVDL